VNEVLNRQKRAAITANPSAHRLTRIMAPGANTNYSFRRVGWRVSKNRKERVSLCVAAHRNIAGVFLFWRETDRYRLQRGRWHWYEAVRDEFHWAPTKREAWAIIERKIAKQQAPDHTSQLSSFPGPLPIDEGGAGSTTSASDTKEQHKTTRRKQMRQALREQCEEATWSCCALDESDAVILRRPSGRCPQHANRLEHNRVDARGLLRGTAVSAVRVAA
jgi:hypothetical protein